jgi:transposase-like protein
VLSGQPANEAIARIEQRFAAAPTCGHCGATRFGKWGMASGFKRYKCKAEGCERTFNAMTGTPLAQLHRRDGWMDYARALVDGVSLRKAAKRTKVCLDTSFRWRHRFLQAAEDVQPAKVEGIVEADETFFLTSAKGSRKLVGRAPRRRDGKAKKPGASEEQIPVLIVRDRHGTTLDAKLPDLAGDIIKSFLRPVRGGARRAARLGRRQGLRQFCKRDRHRAPRRRREPGRARGRRHPSHPESQRLHEPPERLDGPLQRRRQQVPHQLPGLAAV